MIYLDANATTIMPQQVIDQMILWMNKGNPSADYKTAKLSRNMINNFREYIAVNCKFINYNPENTNLNDSVYQVIFTSCASESNNTIIRSTVEAYKHRTGKKPHIILSGIEHKTSLECAKYLLEMHQIELTIIRPDTIGFIHPDDVEKGIRPNTCLISIMSANNETGVIMDISSIGKIAHKHNIIFHTDCVQSFGKFLIDPIKSHVDSFSVSFHKLHGPTGIGALIIKRNLIEKIGLYPLVSGSQNCGMRGGTENVPGIAGAFEATKYTWTNRKQKNIHLTTIKQHLLKRLSSVIPTQLYKDYLHKPLSYNMFIVFISADSKFYLPNTVLLSVIKPTAPLICNGKIKKDLESAGVIVSIGSACNTSSDKASHVLKSMNADTLIKRGTLRLSYQDDITVEQINQFITIFVKILNQF